MTAEWTVAPADDPVLHAFADVDVWRRPLPEVVDLKRGIAERVCGAMERVVAHHLAVDDRLVVEGVWITPAFAARTAYAGSVAGERRRAVFVLGDDPAYLRDAMTRRARGFERWSEHDRDAMAALQPAYGRWLRAEVARHRLASVDARPVDGLAERISAVL